MSFLCPKIKTKKKKTVDAVTSNPRDDRPTEPKKKKKKSFLVSKKGSWNPETPHSNKRLILSSVYNGLYMGSSIKI